MKEYWINVYQDNKGYRWFGDRWLNMATAKAVANIYLIYRIHVRLK